MAARNAVLSALNTLLMTAFPGASVVQTASDPDKFSHQIPQASWPTSSKPLLVIQGDTSSINKDEKTGLYRPQLQTHTVKIHCYVCNSNPASRDDALSNIMDGIKSAIRGDHTLSGTASVAIYKVDKIKSDETLIPPYAGSEIFITIIH